MARARLIIGLTGPNAAGKGEVAAILRRHGLHCHSLSDVVREEAERRGLSSTRENLIRIGNELRRRHGPGVLARKVGRRLRGRDVVDSIRNPAEVEVLRGYPGFVLLGVDAPRRLRFRRSLRRARAGDALTLREFVLKERLENSRRDHAQQLARTLALADVRVRNDRTLRVLEGRVRRVLQDLVLSPDGAVGPQRGAAAARRPRSRRYARARRSRRLPARRRAPGRGTTGRA